MPINSFENYPMTWIPDIETKDPLYKHIATKLELDILSGKLPAGEKLPPQRELADYLDINLSTITRAFQICKNKGLIIGKVGKGTYVASDLSIREPLLKHFNTENFIDLGPSIPISTQQNIIKDIINYIGRRKNLETIFTYVSPVGKETHRDSGVKWLEKHNIKANKNEVVISSGLQNSLAIILTSLFQPGDKLLVASTVYPGLKNIASLLRIQLIPFSLTINGYDIDELSHICNTEKISGIYLSPDHHNPTTYTMPEKERDEISHIIKKYKLLLIEDGSFSFLENNAYFPLTTRLMDSSIYIAPLTNAINPGVRVCYIYTPEKYLNKLALGISGINTIYSPLDAEIASMLISSHQDSIIIKSNIQELNRRNKMINEIIDSKFLQGGLSSQFRWLPISVLINNLELKELCFKYGVNIYRTEKFTIGSSSKNDGYRLAISTPTYNDLSIAILSLRQILSDNCSLSIT